MLTTTSGCIRLVLVRNAQTESNKKETIGDFSGGEMVLTEPGHRMAMSISKIIDYLDTKRHPIDSNDEPTREYEIVVDTSRQQNKLTAQYLLENNVLTIHHYNDVQKYIRTKSPRNDVISTCIIFTSAGIIQKIVNDIVGANIQFGPALCSTTIIDTKIPRDRSDSSYFIHELGGLEAMEYGRYDTTSIRMWNNAT